MPIPGSRRPDRSDENLGVAVVELTPEDLREISRVLEGIMAVEGRD